LPRQNGWFLASQFETAANAIIHENTTGREIVKDFEGRSLDYWVTGYGTGGTVTGVARTLRKELPNTKIILSEPDVAAIVGSGVAQERNTDNTPVGSHPSWAPHPIQGWTPDFIPYVLQDGIDNKCFDELRPVNGAEGMHWAKELASKEGIITGISGGSTFKIAIDIAKSAAPGTNILCMLADTGERYLSSPLFADIAEVMSDEEIAISTSTPGYQFPPAPPA